MTNATEMELISDLGKICAANTESVRMLRTIIQHQDTKIEELEHKFQQSLKARRSWFEYFFG